MPTIHPTAIVGDNAQVGEDSTVEPFAVVEDNVIIGANCTIAHHAVVRRGSILEENVSIDSFAVIGGLPQHLDFDSDVHSGVKIKKNTAIREGVTIHRATRENTYTEIGEHCYLMGNSHVAHDCILGDHVILANGVLLAGNVILQAYCNFGGNALVHQFVRCGEGVMASGGSRFTFDAPPFSIVSDRNGLRGLNLISLKRRGFSQEAITDLKACFHAVARTSGNPAEHARNYYNQGLARNELSQRFLDFFLYGSTKQGYMRWKPSTKPVPVRRL